MPECLAAGKSINMKCYFCKQVLPREKELEIIRRNSHRYIHAKYGKANRCENPNCKKISRTFDWAMIHEKGYLPKRSSFRMLCRSCHTQYDSPTRSHSGGQGFKKGYTPWNKGKNKVYSKAQLKRISEGTKQGMKISGYNGHTFLLKTERII